MLIVPAFAGADRFSAVRLAAAARCRRAQLVFRLSPGEAAVRRRRCRRLPAGRRRDPAAALQEFRSGQRPATVMDRIAKGFTDDEIKAIAAWYGAQKGVKLG